jgi:hypothetical protein
VFILVSKLSGRSERVLIDFALARYLKCLQESFLFALGYRVDINVYPDVVIVSNLTGELV